MIPTLQWLPVRGGTLALSLLLRLLLHPQEGSINPPPAGAPALDDARARYPDSRVVEITVPAAILRARLEARGRETTNEIEDRLRRASELRVSGDDVIRFSNDRALRESIDALIALLTDFAPSRPNTAFPAKAGVDA